ncbi:MAG: NUDIX hydrolase [Pseudomonadota bacterium]
MTDHPDIRDAATLILVRNPATAPKVLLGRRQRGAVFMPDHFVFPGGAVDPGDGDVALAGGLDPLCRARLAGDTPPHAFAAAAIRELWEETGLTYAVPGGFAPPPGWDGFAARRVQPTATGLAFVFRAITPPGRPRRFDARFFLADAAGLAGDRDDFSGASGELSDLAWVAMDELSALKIAPVTQAALRDVAARLPDLGPPGEVPLWGADRDE